jgi:hypothetical protein
MKMRVRAGFMLVAALSLMGLAGCGHYICSEGANFGSSSCTTTGSGGGGGNLGNGTVYQYLLAEVGSSDGMAADTLDLATNTFQEATGFVAPPLPSTVVPDGGTVVVNLPGQKYLYIAFHNGTVYGYAINGATGALSSVPGSPYAVAGGTSITSTPAGTFLFVSDSANGEISAFSISGSDGSLTAVANSPFASGIAAAQMTTDGQGKYLYATEGGAQVAALSIGSTGALTAVLGSPFSFGVSMAKVLGESTGKYLLGISGVDSHIYVFGITSGTGVIAEVTGSPFATAATPLDLVVHPSGTFVYAFDGLSLPMEGFEISASGTLTGVQGSPFTGVNLNAGQFDQSGLYLFGTSQGTEVEFGPYSVDTGSGLISALRYELGGFPGGSFAVSDLNDAP